MTNLARMHEKDEYIRQVKNAFIQCKGVLKEFSQEDTGLPYAPTYSELAILATEEKWLEQRIEYMQSLKRGQDIDKIDIISNQLRMAKKAQLLAEAAIDRMDPSQLDVKDAVALLKWGTHVEQLMMGINNNPMVRFRVDFGTMSDSDLDLIISANTKALTPTKDDLISQAVAKMNLNPTQQNGPTKSANPYGTYTIE